MSECFGTPSVSIAKCADDYHIHHNKHTALSRHAMRSKTIPFNYPLKELIVLFCHGCRDSVTVLVARLAQNSIGVTSPAALHPLLFCVININWMPLAYEFCC